MSARTFHIVLVLVAFGMVLGVGVHGYSYYTTPLQERPFRPDYAFMKPSGTYSHTLGITGAAMISVGVGGYALRKRWRVMRDWGKLSRWLEVHIFLCVMGAILVVFHSTFKASGVAAISFWTMTAVASSGFVGRFLYTQIPRTLQGAELTAAEISAELSRLGTSISGSPAGARLVAAMDEAFGRLTAPASPAAAVSAYFRLVGIRRDVRRAARRLAHGSHISREHALALERGAGARAALLQRSVMLRQAGRLFHMWHVIHLPFTVIMFITLAAHVTVTVLLGYRWIF